MSDIDKQIDEILDFSYAFTTNKYADTAKQRIKALISTAVREALDSIKIPPVYKGDDSLGKEYQCGYNDMVIATELLIADIKSQIAQLKEGVQE